MLLKSVFYLIIMFVVWGSSFSQSTQPNDSLPETILILSRMRKNGHTKEIRLLPGYALELLLSTPNDSLITYYEHKMEGKLISSTDSTLTLAVTGNYRYISYANGSWLEDYFDYSADSAILKTFHLDSVSCLYSSREWLRYPRKVSMNLTRIFIGVSLINSISGNGSITNSVLFLLGVAGIYGEFALGGKKYWLEYSDSTHLFRRRIWKAHRE